MIPSMLLSFLTIYFNYSIMLCFTILHINSLTNERTYHVSHKQVPFIWVPTTPMTGTPVYMYSKSPWFLLKRNLFFVLIYKNIFQSFCYASLLMMTTWAYNQIFKLVDDAILPSSNIINKAQFWLFHQFVWMMPSMYKHVVYHSTQKFNYICLYVFW